MPTTIAQKLKIKEGMVLLTMNAPADFKTKVEGLPQQVTVTSETKSFDQLHWFIKDMTQLKKELPGVLDRLQNGATCWMYYPKGSSGIQTDLTRDTAYPYVLKHDVQFITLISFDDTWSAFGLRLKSEKDQQKKPKERPIFQYIDPVKKTVTLPEDFLAALEKHKSELEFFSGLSFSNKKEYLEWIVSAKREETRSNRVKESIERLSKGWKNPANR